MKGKLGEKNRGEKFFPKKLKKSVIDYKNVGI